MTPRFLLDTHVVVRWFFELKKLSPEQFRVIRESERQSRNVAVSAYSLVEIANLTDSGRSRIDARLGDIFDQLESDPLFQILPITIPIAREMPLLSMLRDPADRVIVATARIHNLRLLTSDQRIIDSRLVSVID